jgi:hypothetical protein
LKQATRCAICGREVPKWQGFSDAHGVVCSFRCAGEFNRKHGMDYAWKENR